MRSLAAEYGVTVPILNGIGRRLRSWEQQDRQHRKHAVVKARVRTTLVVNVALCEGVVSKLACGRDADVAGRVMLQIAG